MNTIMQEEQETATIPDSVVRRIVSIHAAQLSEGNFDCFGKASSGYCDQTNCAYRDECLPLSQEISNINKILTM